MEFNACLGLGYDENGNAETLFGGQYAEIFDRKYYNKEYGGSHSMKEDTSDELKKKHTLYRQLAWCAVKKYMNQSSQKRMMMWKKVCVKDFHQTHTLKLL